MEFLREQWKQGQAIHNSDYKILFHYLLSEAVALQRKQKESNRKCPGIHTLISGGIFALKL